MNMTMDPLREVTYKALHEASDEKKKCICPRFPGAEMGNGLGIAQHDPIPPEGSRDFIHWAILLRPLFEKESCGA